MGAAEEAAPEVARAVPSVSVVDAVGAGAVREPVLQPRDRRRRGDAHGHRAEQAAAGRGRAVLVADTGRVAVPGVGQARRAGGGLRVERRTRRAGRQDGRDARPGRRQPERARAVGRRVGHVVRLRRRLRDVTLTFLRLGVVGDVTVVAVVGVLLVERTELGLDGTAVVDGELFRAPHKRYQEQNHAAPPV